MSTSAGTAAMSASISDSMAETRRRQRATVTGGESTLDDESGYTREFQSDDQKVMLWNTANTHLHPRSVFPAFRILGLFPDTDTALAHAEQVVTTDPSCALRIVETHAWYTIPERNDGPDPVSKVNRNLLHHQTMLQEHATEFQTRHDALTEGRTPAMQYAQDAEDQALRDEKQRARRKAIYRAALDQDEATIERLREQFEVEMEEVAHDEINAQLRAQLRAQLAESETQGREAAMRGVEEQKTETPYVDPVLTVPIAPEILNENWEENVAAVAAAAVTVEGKDITPQMPPPVSRMVEVRNQRYAVVSVVIDYETTTTTSPMGKEPGVIVWAAFDTEEEALRYNKCVASKKLRDHDLAIVSMYEWLYPHMMNSDRVDQLYRNEELNNIMKHARTTSTHVREFEEMCKREEIDVPTLAVEPDLSEPAPRTWVPPVGSELDNHQ